MNKSPIEIFELIKNSKADINSKRNNTIKNYYDELELDSPTVLIDALIRIGEDIKQKLLKKTTEKKTPIDLIKLITSKGTDIKIKNKENQTPIKLKLQYRTPIEVIELLIDNGVNINSKDKDNSTPLHVALEYSSPIEVIELLISKGADLNARNINNITPIHTALQYNAPIEVIELLINNGANLNAKTKENQTVIHTALEFNSPINIFGLLVNSRFGLSIKDINNLTPLFYAYVKIHDNCNYISLLIDKVTPMIHYLDPLITPNYNVLLLSVILLKTSISNENEGYIKERVKFMKKRLFENINTPSFHYSNEYKKSSEKEKENLLKKFYHFPDLLFLTYEILSFYTIYAKCKIDFDYIISMTGLSENTKFKNGFCVKDIKRSDNIKKVYEKRKENCGWSESFKNANKGNSGDTVEDYFGNTCKFYCKRSNKA